MGIKTKTSFQEGNTTALKHGGEKALYAIRKGEPFDGMLSQILLEKLAAYGYGSLEEAETAGAIGMERVEICRQAVASECFWRAALGAAAQGDVEKWDYYAGRGLWAGNIFLTNSRKVREEQAANDDIIEAALGSIKNRDR